MVTIKLMDKISITIHKCRFKIEMLNFDILLIISNFFNLILLSLIYKIK
jgi:hypothetical protein